MLRQVETCYMHILEKSFGEKAAEKIQVNNILFLSLCLKCELNQKKFSDNSLKNCILKSDLKIIITIVYYAETEDLIRPHILIPLNIQQI